MSNSQRPLLYSRAQVGALLGNVSVASVVRLERAGQLTPVRLKAGGQVFYRAAEVEALAAEPVE